MTLEDLKKIIQDKYLHDSGFRCKVCKNMHHGAFKLSNGKESNKYFDIKGLMCDRDDSAHLYSAFNEFLGSGNWRLRRSFKTFGGLELGGIPIATLLNGMYGKTCCFIRKSERVHGLKKMIEGNPVSPILLVDDVISSGLTVVNALKELRKQKFEVAGILCVINRTAIENIVPIHLIAFDEMNYPVYSLFEESDFE